MPHEPQNIELHNEMLNLLKEFHNLCIKNDIKYSLHGGTLLGAIREKGFIPWDDDMDVTMTRAEFEKFESVIKNSSSLPFDYDSRKYKLIRRIDSNSFAWIDIFIYDYISENSFMQKIKILVLSFLKAWAKTSEEMKITKIRGLYKGWKYLLIYFVHVLGMPFSEKYKAETAAKAYASFPGNKKLIHRSNDQYAGLIIILPSSAMDKYETAEFEDTPLMITSDYDLILRTSYGDDYMTPKKFDNDIKAHAIYKQNESR